MNTFKNISDAELVLTYQNTQNPAAFGELYRRYNKKVFLYCVKILKNRDSALDLTQDIFVKIANKLGQLNHSNTFVAWLFRIAYNDCMDFLKNSKKNQVNPIHDNYDQEEEVFDYEAAFQKESQFQQLEIVMNQISAQDRQLLMERYFEKKSIQELVEKYNLSESAMKMRLARSRNKIKKLCLKAA